MKKLCFKTKKLITLTLALITAAAIAIPASAADYTFNTGKDTASGFGKATSTDKPVTPDKMSQNIRRNKDAAYLPPPYGVFSGEIPTEPSSPYHSNTPQSGFVPAGQDLPPNGGESYASGSGKVSARFLPATSQVSPLKTTPLYYDDGSIGVLYTERTGEIVKIYEGESLDNLKKGAGHFTNTSAWDGNVGLAGHNRGVSGYFWFVKDLQNGDSLTLTTKYGSRVYKVYSKVQIGEYDSLPLSWTEDNILTLITCIADVPEQRFCVQAREVKQ